MTKLNKVLTLTLALILGAALSHLPHRKHPRFIGPITPERVATHMITFYDKSGHRDGLCTGTAVGPHALLTASHCDEDIEDVTVSLDLSVKKYIIIGSMTDKSDHLILHLNGPEFKNIVTIKERPAVYGETVTSYGDGGEDFPQHAYYGKVEPLGNGGDTSEIDIADGIREFTLPVIPGDSGSAVYGRDGDIVALITYSDNNDEENFHEAVGFALSFTPEQLEKISKPDAPAANANLPTVADIMKLLQE